MSSEAVTLRQIAESVGCDISTVSKVLHGGNIRVRPDTAERIFAAAERLRYHPNAAARSLRLQRTLALGMLLPDLANPVYATIVRGAVRRAEALGYVMLVGELHHERAEEAFERLLSERRIDGLIVATAEDSQELAAHLSADSRPFVFVNRSVTGASRSVTLDDEAGGALAAGALYEAGHRSLGLVAGPDEVDTAHRRRLGFERRCRELGLSEPLVETTKYTARGGYEATKRLLESTPRPTGLFASNLLVSLGALNAVHAANLAVPGDISLVGFDDDDIAAFTWPPLTGIRLPFEEMGEVVVNEIDRIIGGGAPRDVVVKTKPAVVMRATLGPPTHGG